MPDLAGHASLRQMCYSFDPFDGYIVTSMCGAPSCHAIRDSGAHLFSHSWSSGFPEHK